MKTDRCLTWSSAWWLKKCVRLEPALTPRHCHVWHQSTCDNVSRAAGSLSWRSFSRATAGAPVTTQLFYDWPNSPHDNNDVFLTSSISIQLTNLILLGKYHIRVKKWTKAKLNFEHFIKEIKQYGATLDQIKNKNPERHMKLFVTLNCCNVTPGMNCFTLHILMNAYLFLYLLRVVYACTNLCIIFASKNTVLKTVKAFLLYSCNVILSHI